MKRLIATSEYWENVKDGIHQMAQSDLGQKVLLSYLYAMIKVNYTNLYEKKEDTYNSITKSKTVKLLDILPNDPTFQEFINKIKQELKQNGLDKTYDDVDIALMCEHYAFKNYPKDIFDKVYDEFVPIKEKYLKEYEKQQEKSLKKTRQEEDKKNEIIQKYKNAYNELLNKDDNIGDNVKTILNYDSYDSRFVYLDGNVLVENKPDHIEVLNDLYKQLGYNSAMDYIDDGHPNPKFYAGKMQNNIAILETDNWKVRSNAEIADVINALKKQGAQKVYVCENSFEQTDLLRVAKKRLIKR